MTETGLENFDRTLQKTHLWLKDVGEAVGPDKQRQYHALRAVLWALRDRLTVDQAFHLSSPMPLLVRASSGRITSRPESPRTAARVMNSCRRCRTRSREPRQ